MHNAIPLLLIMSWFIWCVCVPASHVHVTVYRIYWCLLLDDLHWPQMEREDFSSGLEYQAYLSSMEDVQSSAWNLAGHKHRSKIHKTRWRFYWFGPKFYMRFWLFWVLACYVYVVDDQKRNFIFDSKLFVMLSWWPYLRCNRFGYFLVCQVITCVRAGSFFILWELVSYFTKLTLSLRAKLETKPVMVIESFYFQKTSPPVSHNFRKVYFWFLLFQYAATGAALIRETGDI